MKHLFTAMLLLVASFATAQIVNIPDSNFKYALLHNYNPSIDINNNGEIEVNEALQVTTLFLPGGYVPQPIVNLTGIEAFINLETFGIYNNNVQADFLDVSALRKLKDLNFLGNEKIRKLKTGTLDSLTDLTCAYEIFDTLDLRGCRNLINLDIGFASELKSLDISGLTKLITLHPGSSLTSLKANGCTGLISVRYTHGITDLDLRGCTNLSALELYELGVRELDLSSNPNLKDLIINSSTLHFLNLKNGSQLNERSLLILFIPDSTTLNICADEFEVDILRSYFNTLNPPANVTSYCTFFPGGTYNTIKGKTRLDLNNNGCDNADAGMPNVPIRINDTSGNTLIRYTSPSGDYAHYPYKGVFTLTPYFPYPYYSVTPANTIVTFDTANSLVNTTNFCIQPNGIHNDLEITFLPSWPPANPGRNAAYTLVYKNRGTTTLSGNVAVNFDNSKMNFISASENVTTQSTGQLTWNYNNLQPFENKTINVTFNLLAAAVS